jgi:DNA transposition AAA+ family ATPase
LCRAKPLIAWLHDFGGIAVSILSKRRPYLESLGLPDDAEMIRRCRAFIIRAGLTQCEFAELAGLNANSFRVFLSGAYNSHATRQIAESNTLAIRAAIKKAIDLRELDTVAPASGRHYSTSEYEGIRDSMWAALTAGTAFIVDGPPGTQKTYTFRRVAEEINKSEKGQAVYVYARVEHSPASFLVEACTEAGIPNRGNIDQLIRKLRYFLGSRRTLLIVDEAQHLGFQGLEVLRQLLDQPPYFGIALGGSHDLLVRLKDWRMEQWRSRLRRTHLLKGLSQAEASKILQAELGKMSAKDVAETVQDAVVEAERNKQKFTYISARNLFFAIDDARALIEKGAHQPKSSEVA